MKVTLNINDEVTVKLTKDGAEVYNRFICGLYLRKLGAVVKEEGDTLTTELWQIMTIFGGKTYMGGPQHFIENRLEVKG
jgi:hypothetical protein